MPVVPRVPGAMVRRGESARVVRAEPAVVATFLYRWKAERYAHEQVRALRGKGVSAAYAA